MIWVYYILLLIFMLLGLAIAIVGLPGLWLMLLCTIIYGWLAHWMIVGPWTLVIIAAICLLSEIIETASGAIIAKRAGGSKRAMIAAAIGAILGGIFFTFIPIPGIAQIVGACLGAGLGAVLAELTAQQHIGNIARVGIGAIKGRFIGTMTKLLLGAVIYLIVMVIAFP